MDFPLIMVVYLIFVFCAILYEIRVESVIIREGKKRKAERRVKGSYTIMALSYIVLLVGTIGEYFWMGREINHFISLIGIVLYILGHLLRNWAVHTLNEYWSVHIEFRENHQLVKNGPYQYLRHPGYLAVILKGIGFTLIPNAYYTFIYSLGIYIPIILVRAHLEEKELLQKFGNAYLEYQKEVPGFFPIKKFKKGLI